MIKVPLSYVPRSQYWRMPSSYRVDGFEWGTQDGVWIGGDKSGAFVWRSSMKSRSYEDYLIFWRARKKVYDGDVLD